MSTHELLIQWLQNKKVDFQLLTHDEASTCEEAARLRGSELQNGGKTLLFIVKGSPKLATLPANCQVSSNRLRKIWKTSKLRFCTPEELLLYTGVVPGALPPFNGPWAFYDHYLDSAMLFRQEISFNAGVLNKSITLPMKIYLQLFSGYFASFGQ